MTTALQIRPFETGDEAAAVALWRECGLLRPWNDPHKDIVRKQAVQPGLFLVALADGKDGESVLVGTAMGGYDGHRGSVYYLAVAPGRQRLAIGRSLMEHVECQLLAMGCPKINVLVRTANEQVVAFYEKLGYARDDAFSLGKRLIPDL